jgi:hypothetical protein
VTAHIQPIVTPPSEHALAATVGRTRFRFSRHVDHLHGRGGRL